ncbi:MAG: SRPBCC domain-containing protein [Fimbriimonadaceae bacterium]|nr:SRPBCC domain-containing protein [Fimbriimonadaceae bacterium]
MDVTLQSDFPVTDAAAQAATGKTLTEWFATLDDRGTSDGRREVIQWLYDQTGRGKDVWWPTTVWVEYERAKGVVNKKDCLGEGYNICVTKTVVATPDAVYQAFTDAPLCGWLGCDGATEGGAYRDSGGNTGTWLRLRPGKDVRIAWRTKGVEHGTQVDAAFADKGGGKTGITLTHARIQSREEADGLRAAWGAAFDRLKAQLEAR